MVEFIGVKMKLRIIISHCILMLMIIFLFEIGYSKSKFPDHFVCKDRSAINGKNEKETQSLRLSYIQELDLKMEKDKKEILSYLESKSPAQYPQGILLNYMKKILCMDNFSGELDYFQDLYDIKNKFNNKSHLKNHYHAELSQLVTKEQERIQEAFEAIEHSAKNGDF